MYSTAEAYDAAMDSTIDKYAIREKAAVAKLTKYCANFPLETEMSTLDASIQENLLYAIYYQIQYDKDNDLLEDNNNYTRVVLGNFEYSTNTGGTTNTTSAYSNTALLLLRDTGICSNKVEVRKKCSWFDGFIGGC